MAKKRKTRKTTSRKRRRGLGSLKDKSKRIGLLLTGVIAANAAHEGLQFINGMEALMVKPAMTKDENGNDVPGTVPKVNLKKLGVNGGLMIAGGLGTVMLKDDYMSEVAKGVAIAASIQLKEEIVKPAIGMGSVSDFLDLYRNDEPMGNTFQDRVPLGNIAESSSPEELALKIG